MKTINNYEDWVTSTVDNKLQAESQEKLQKQARGNTRQDATRPILEDLQSQGYTTIQWDASNSRHSVCLELDRQQWTIEDFLSGLSHDAPMFERSHPGDTGCSVIVSGPDLPTLSVDSFGNTDEA